MGAIKNETLAVLNKIKKDLGEMKDKHEKARLTTFSYSHGFLENAVDVLDAAIEDAEDFKWP